MTVSKIVAKNARKRDKNENKHSRNYNDRFICDKQQRQKGNPMKKLQSPPHCPRCGKMTDDHNRLLAVSRRANRMICESCGTLEALEDYGAIPKLALSDWVYKTEDPS